MIFLLAAALFHVVAIQDLTNTIHTHVAVTATVALVKTEADGDIHIRLCSGKACAVAEIIPLIPLPHPAKGDCITVRGISRIDKKHKWAEIHPVESWNHAVSCSH